MSGMLWKEGVVEGRKEGRKTHRSSKPQRTLRIRTITLHNHLISSGDSIKPISDFVDIIRIGREREYLVKSNSGHLFLLLLHCTI